MESQLKQAVLKDKTVLLVEDEPQGRELLVHFLQMIGCKKVMALSSGEEALDYLRSDAPDLVLLNYHLPGIDGLSTLHHMKIIRPEVPVIMMTGYTTHQATLKALEEGAIDLATKPLDLRRLEKQVLQGIAG